MNQNIKITMTKQEAIKFYANKIVEDSLADCSEFNYCMTIEHYNDNGFVKQNQNEILEVIKQDERVADVCLNKSSKPYTFDMVFWTDYCPNYYEDVELNPVFEKNILRKFIDKLINIKENAIPQYHSTTREIINDFLSYISDPHRVHFPLNEDEKDNAYEKLKEYVANSKFASKYLEKYQIFVNKQNIKELIKELEDKCKQNGFYRDDTNDLIKYLKKEQVNQILQIFNKDKIYPSNLIGQFLFKDENKIIAIDNRDGKAYIEEFDSEEEAIKYLQGEEEEEENEPI